MSSTANIRVDFFHVSSLIRTSSFARAIKAISEMSDEQRTVDLEGIPTRLTQYSEDPHFISGDLLRVRMEKVPVKANVLSGTGEEIDLDDDEGIGEETAFLFHKQSQVLVFQRNRFGTSARRCMRYIDKLLDGQSFEPVPIQDSRASSQFRNMKDIRKIVIGLHAKDAGIVTSIGEEIDGPMAPCVSIAFSRGHLKGGLDRTECMGLIRKVREKLGIEATKIDVYGKLSDDESTAVLDLIGQNLQSVETITIGSSRHAEYGQRLNALRRAYSNNSDRLP